MFSVSLLFASKSQQPGGTSPMERNSNFTFPPEYSHFAFNLKLDIRQLFLFLFLLFESIPNACSRLVPGTTRIEIGLVSCGWVFSGCFPPQNCLMASGVRVVVHFLTLWGNNMSEKNENVLYQTKQYPAVSRSFAGCIYTFGVHSS